MSPQRACCLVLLQACLGTCARSLGLWGTGSPGAWGLAPMAIPLPWWPSHRWEGASWHRPRHPRVRGYTCKLCISAATQPVWPPPISDPNNSTPGPVGQSATPRGYLSCQQQFTQGPELGLESRVGPPPPAGPTHPVLSPTSPGPSAIMITLSATLGWLLSESCRNLSGTQEMSVVFDSGESRCGF